ncbi:MAG TPA: relaxase/mobilization nuclease domain-containing protein [Puia sp.]|nr:relaxase/mobilization nuclease domain-containing protein [Puia sp.]
MRSSINFAMIGKIIFTGRGFRAICRYVLQRPEHSRVLAVEGVRGHDAELMAQDFEWQWRLMPAKEKPVFHAVLSFPPGEKVDDERLVEISRKYLQLIRMADTQYVFVKHTDTDHLHVHIIANRVNNAGDAMVEGLIIKRTVRVTRQLTTEYGLRPEQGKHLEQTRMDVMSALDNKRYRLYQAILEELPKCRSLDDLERRLGARDVSVRYRLDEKTKERVGISFRFDKASFKGSRVDAAYSLQRLQQTLALQQQLAQEEKLRQEPGRAQTQTQSIRRTDSEDEYTLRQGRRMGL